MKQKIDKIITLYISLYLNGKDTTSINLSTLTIDTGKRKKGNKLKSHKKAKTSGSD